MHANGWLYLRNEHLFRVGLKGICEEILSAQKSVGQETSVAGEEQEFLACALAGIRALHTIELKFACAARTKGMEELAQIAERVPWEAPQTFHEGLCTMAFLRKALGALEGVGFNSFGRADVLLAPLYERDLAKGVSEEELLDLVSRFLLIWDCTLDRNKSWKPAMNMSWKIR